MCHNISHASEVLLADGGTEAATLSASDKRGMLETMLRIRRLEQAWGDAYLDGAVEGLPPSLSTGQEAIYVGANAALADGDYQFTTHRGQGSQVAAGLDPDRILDKNVPVTKRVYRQYVPRER